MPGEELIVGFDPGLAHCGYGLLSVHGSRLRHIAHGVIRTASAEREELRLLSLHERIGEILRKYRPVRAGVESIYFARNVRSAIPVAQARGVVMLCCAEFGVVLYSYSPPQIKQRITGIGAAEKNQIKSMLKFLLGLERVPGSDHASDALAAAYCASQEGALQGALL